MTQHNLCRQPFGEWFSQG